MKKTLIILGIIVLLGAAFYFSKRNNNFVLNGRNTQSVATSTTTSNNTTQTTEDIKFTGTIQAVDNKQPVDGNLLVKINDIWIVIGGESNTGVVIGFDLDNVQANVGKKAEVSARKTGYDQSLTILGDSKYYLKIVQ